MQRQKVILKARYPDISTLIQRLRVIFPDDPDISCKHVRGHYHVKLLRTLTQDEMKSLEIESPDHYSDNHTLSQQTG
ncbi:hypothetical protein CGCF415_v011742 [Colletotrichum fructicola]|uniref:Uncharacterized protein n=1 Tax=Colletotrichum fructicola (strain Nara gc5) TaxID=1213859 RepID=A0A7J6IRU0_COLFN|nr:uncharacterized protein CGMCC3_g3339 [Colletotrichum fructicola]KAF4479057.1 hypothetical protein CGGC5_v012645 [Colletotrichum fructicola Nara gc5]KAE9580701.1 hypothetical protein CGMCC3_g3339 [Colletotrichum fructicola]KAF4896018.1 hypothetical protein CGCF415_v011742 [Colletotrichum fructicola]KAF4900867.1 hypothetical protein CGCFRS4_v003082 [Colletotrichum fructicola]KAF4930257.1 hypothetical protein CGCF245_v011767 [Colletotrichum fructicola]